MKKKIILTRFSTVTTLLLLLSIPLFAQTAYNGFNRLHYEQLLRTNSCPRCYLYRAKLSNIDLTGADLRGSTLTGATFRNATLRNADLGGARIGGAVFSGADLSGATWVNGRQCSDGSIGTCGQ